MLTTSAIAVRIVQHVYPEPLASIRTSVALNIAEVRGQEIQEESLRFVKKIVDTQFEDDLMPRDGF